MTLKVSFDSATEAKLREEARAAGKPVEQIVREAVEARFAQPADSSATQSVDDRVRRWRDWVDSHPNRQGVNLDDSRAPIYGERGE